MALFKTSKEGDSVLEEAAQDLLAFSEHSIGKIYIDRVDAINDGVTLSIPHGLSYVPIFMAFGENASGEWFPLNGGAILAGPTMYATADASNVKITNNDGGTRNARTFVFIDRLT